MLVSGAAREEVLQVDVITVELSTRAFKRSPRVYYHF